MTSAKLKRLFENMLAAIGGEGDRDVEWYLNKRPKTISRDSFFEALIWAVWVAGKSRVAADTFLQGAKDKGFTWNYKSIASWDQERLSQFMQNLHGWTVTQGRPSSRPVPKGAIARWNVIHNIAKRLADYENEEDFQKAFFGEKTTSALLDKGDIQRLINSNIPFIKEANAHFIIRNMGGEAIKRDRWVDSFLSYYRLTKDQLEYLLQATGIPFGFFDTVFWLYCEKFVGETRSLAEHFDRAFPEMVDA